LFDFDFSALLGKQIISNNLLLYNLTWKPCTYVVNEDCTLFIEENNVVKVQPKIDKTDFNINEFMFIFDYFRLLFSILKKRRISYEIISDKTDREFENISRNIILWYTNLDKTKDNDWNCHFKGNVFLPIYNFIRSDKEHIKKTNEELNKQYEEFQQKILQGKYVKTESDMSSFFDDEILSYSTEGGGGNKLKKYTRLGRAHINKDNKRTSRVIYKSGNGYYIRDVKGIYTLVKKKDLTFA
jgi:hypothetical protein